MLQVGTSRVHAEPGFGACSGASYISVYTLICYGVLAICLIGVALDLGFRTTFG